MNNSVNLKIGDIIYLTKPFEWLGKIYPISSPIKILNKQNFRGYDIEFIETGEIVTECNPELKFSKVNPTKTIIIMAFPGMGKTYVKEKYKGTNVKVLDSDSSNFDKDTFPDDYIEYIASQLGKFDIIMVSTHKEVRNAIYKYFPKNKKYIVIPNINDKDEFIKRYKDRGNSESFIKLIEQHWEEWISEIKSNPNYNYYELTYLTELIDNIL